MQIIIKNYDLNDFEPCKELIDLSFEEKDLLHILEESKYEFAFSAFTEGKLVGIALGWASSFHAYCTYFKILIHPLYAGQDVMEKFLLKIKNLQTIQFPLQTSTWETSLRVRDVYEQQGFKEISRTYMPSLQVTDMIKNVQIIENDRYITKTLATISSNDELMEQLSFVVRKNYEAAHQANPIVDTVLDDWQELILASDTVVNGSLIFLDKDEKEIIAYSFLHESDSEYAYELGWCGCSNKQYKGLVSQLVHKQIQYARNQGIKTIIGEFDTTDHYAMEVLKTFPFAPCPTWIAYQKK